MYVLRCAAVGLVALLGACGDTRPEPPPAQAPAALVIPSGVLWKWTGSSGADPVVVAHPARYTLEFLDDGQYSVRADCNSGSGRWSLSEGVLTLSPGPMTLAACGPETLDQRYLQLLESATRFTRAGDRLSLLLGQGETRMEFDAVREISLAGSSWLVRACNDGRGAVVSVDGDSELHVSFNEDGTVTGSAGCNRFNASYTLDSDGLQIGAVATTRRSCAPPSLMEQETRFLAALQTVSAWQARGGRAQLRRPDGALAVDLVAALTGTASRAEGPAIPRDALLRVELLDISRTDAASPVLAEYLGPPGQAFPQSFQLEYDPSQIDAGRSYSLRATISSGADILYTTVGVYPVLTRDHARYGLALELEPGESREPGEPPEK